MPLKCPVAAFALTCLLLTGCDGEPCVPAEVVRIKIQDTVYRLPATIRPDIFGTNLSTEYKARSGRKVREYCQRLEDAPATADSFGLGQASLAQIAMQNPEFSRLRGVELIEINYAPASHSPAENSTGTLVSGGLFRRVDHNGNFELFSTRPLLFGRKISAFCGPAPTYEPSISCDAWGQITPGTLIRVRLNDSTHPLENWPRTLKDVERLIETLTTP